jgi:chitinase
MSQCHIQRCQRYLVPIALIFVTLLCVFSGSIAYSANDNTGQSGKQGLSSANADMIKASYLQLDAVGSLGSVTQSGYASSNILLFAFANLTSPNVNPTYLAAMQTAINNESPGTLNILSIGGQYATSAAINIHTVNAIVSNVSGQIDGYNAQLRNGKISGVDLDLENEIDAETISALAKAFKTRGFSVSAAPQVYLTSGNQVNSADPFNLALTSGGAHNQYGPAIASGYVDYIFAQTYNTGGWTVDNHQENDVGFFSAIARALNSTVKNDCRNSGVLCIPSTTKIAIGQVANAGASGTMNNVFASNGSISYNQAAILGSLSSQWKAMQADPSNYGYIKGIMQWSLNNDYMPNGWGDTFATPGAFSATLFGAAPPPQIPFFIVQITNSGPDEPGSVAYASATLVVNGQYWIFGRAASWVPSGMVPIAPGRENYQLWGTLPSSKNPNTPGVADSSNLDTIFSNGNTSFTTSQILINGYPSYDSDISNPSGQWNCPAGANYRFEAGHAYNILVNPTWQSCAVSRVN